MEAKINIFQNNAKNSNVILTSRSNEMDQSFKIFQNEGFGKIRVVIDEKGEPWFVGNDIAKCLGYDTPKNAVKKYVDEDDSFMFVINSESGGIKINPTENQYVKEIRLINESGLYSLVFSSKLESAKLFKKWVTKEVLPSIRKTGSYNKNRVVLPDFTNPSEAAEAWAKEYRRAEQAEKLALAEHARAEQEKAEKETAVKTLVEKQEDLEFSESFIEPGENDMLVRQVAAKLEQNNIIIAEKNLRKFLQEIQFFTKRVEDGQYELRADMIKKGYAFYRSYYVDKYSGEKVHKQTVYITGLGYKAIAKAMKTNCKKIFLKYGRFRESYL